MNTKQRLVLKLTALVIVAMVLYPPYQLVGRGLGYHWIFTGPDYEFATIDGNLLLVQWVGVCLMGGIAYLLARGDTKGDEPGMFTAPVLLQGAGLLIWPMRALRALALIYAIVGGLGLIVDLIQLTAYDEAVALDPGKVAALMLMKSLGFTAVLGLALGLRVLINKIHREKTGTAALLLPSWRSL